MDNIKKGKEEDLKILDGSHIIYEWKLLGQEGDSYVMTALKQEAIQLVEQMPEEQIPYITGI